MLEYDALAPREALECVRCTAFDCYSAALRLRLQGCVGAVLGTLEHTLHTTPDLSRAGGPVMLVEEACMLGMDSGLG